MQKPIPKANWEKYKSVYLFLFSLGLAFGLTWLVKEPEFNDTQVYVLFLLFFSLGLWFTEAVPAFAVSIFIIAYLVYMLGNENLNSAPEDIEKYVTTFSSSIIWLMLGGFFMAAGMTKTKLDESLFRFTLKVSGSNPRNLLFGLMVTTMVASMLMSNTATTAMVIASILPLLKSLGKGSPTAKALLLGVSIAATTGGMGTIIGSPPNLIAIGALQSIGIEVSFLDWMIYGLPIAIVLTGLSFLVLVRVYLKNSQPISLDFLQVQQKELSNPEKMKRITVIVIISVTIILWLTTSFHGLKVGAVSAIPLVFLPLFGILKNKDVQGLPWDTLLLVAGGLSLGMGMLHSGLLDYYAEFIKGMDVYDIIILLIFAFVTMLFSNIISNTATSTVLIPLGMVILVNAQSEIALIIGLAASTALFLPVSTPPNAIAFSTEMLDIKDFRIGGLLVGLLGPILIVLWILFVS
jgi:solute carrier family 13 (sodium-dependent dicarboxylate transporter), member 2/3/5